ncbi:MAG: sulfotransferase domain-containing protein [Proteobacteria bacterium]|nr:sulfotransferase domain-containing protein [Pseudomonadota bacterium]
MLVLCTGMIRSGSTWSFNVVKQLLARAAPAVRGGYADEVGEALRLHGAAADHLVVKCHAPDVLGRAMIKQRLCRTIYTYREPLEAVVSAIGLKNSHLEEATARIKASLELLRFQIEAGGVRCLWYGDVVENPQACVEAIAEYLGLALPPEAIVEVAERLSRENVRRLIKAQARSASQTSRGGALWDSDTLFNDHHIRDNPADPAHVLSDRQVAFVTAQLGDFVDRAGALHAGIRDLGALAWATDEPPRVWPTASEPATIAPPSVEVAAAAAADLVAAIDAPAPPDAAPATPAEMAAPIVVEAAAAAPADAAAPPPAAAPPGAAAAAAPPKSAAAFDPHANAERRALARQLLRTLGARPAAKSRPL